VSELSASAAHEEAPETTNRMSQRVVDRGDALFSPSDASQIGTQVAHAWEGVSGLMLLAFVFSRSGLSYAVIGGWIGVDARTICCCQPTGGVDCNSNTFSVLVRWRLMKSTSRLPT